MTVIQAIQIIGQYGTPDQQEEANEGANPIRIAEQILEETGMPATETPIHMTGTEFSWNYV